jgi:hypothetical protein
VDTGSILGLSALRPSLLVDVPAAKPRKSQACLGAQLMTHRHLVSQLLTNPFRVDADLDDDDDVDDDDDDEFGDDDDSDEEGEGEEDNDEETETWQVSSATGFR